MNPIFAAILAALLSIAQPADPPELPGSTRNARIARPMPADAAQRASVTLTFLASTLTDVQIAELAQLAPNVRIILASTREAALEHAAAADGIDARLLSADMLAKAQKVSWIHSPSAGVERLLTIPGLRDRKEITITNAKGVHGPAIADHAIASLLALTRQLPHYLDAQHKGEWMRGQTPHPAQALAGKTMLIVGLGGIGTEIARRAHAFDVEIIATRRSDVPAPDFVSHVGKPDELVSLLPRADIIAVCTPLTPETENLFDAAMFKHVKRGAYIINIARGKIINTDAMVAALKDGTLAGAALDVTEPEPLPKGHPLWSMSNVIITPHIAADGDITDQRWWALFRENIRRFGQGEQLLNCVDVDAGY
ncbi:MAG TPA: D-2-hydroxyacid dehydrogenase [Phycisphaerales bacterium]|nr:D-2-hydroxyacid dehydrogenase [Phycisphaerales bacterium]